MEFYYFAFLFFFFWRGEGDKTIEKEAEYIAAVSTAILRINKRNLKWMVCILIIGLAQTKEDS